MSGLLYSQVWEFQQLHSQFGVIILYKFSHGVYREVWVHVLACFCDCYLFPMVIEG